MWKGFKNIKKYTSWQWITYINVINWLNIFSLQIPFNSAPKMSWNAISEGLDFKITWWCFCLFGSSNILYQLPTPLNRFYAYLVWVGTKVQPHLSKRFSKISVFKRPSDLWKSLESALRPYWLGNRHKQILFKEFTATFISIFI